MKELAKYEQPELIGQIISVFEDFLEEKGICIENAEKKDDPESAESAEADWSISQSTALCVRNADGIGNLIQIGRI